MKKVGWMAMALPIALLGSCGGGGGDAPAPAPAPAPQPTTTNPQAALKAMLTQARSYALAGIGNDGKAYGLGLSFAATNRYTFSDGSNYPATRVTSQLSSGGVPLSTAFVDYVYDDANGRVLWLNYSDGACGVLSTSSAAPTSASAGAVGALFAGKRAGGCLTIGAITDITGTWSVERDGANLLACLIVQTKFLAVTKVEAYCFAVSESGVPQSAARITLNSGEGLTMTLR